MERRTVANPQIAAALAVDLEVALEADLEAGHEEEYQKALASGLEAGLEAGHVEEHPKQIAGLEAGRMEAGLVEAHQKLHASKHQAHQSDRGLSRCDLLPIADFEPLAYLSLGLPSVVPHLPDHLVLFFSAFCGLGFHRPAMPVAHDRFPTHRRLMHPIILSEL